MMDTMIPPGVEKRFPKAASETGAVKVLEEMVRYTPFVTAIGLRAGIWFIEIMGPLYAGRLRRFSKLDQAGREQVLNRMYQSKIYFIRQMVLLIKMTACFGWGADPETKRGSASPISQVCEQEQVMIGKFDDRVFDRADGALVTDADYAVIGTGPSGATAAWVLAQAAMKLR